MAESSRGNDKVKKEVEPLLGAVDSFTHGGIRKTKFEPKVPARRLKKLSAVKSEPGEGGDAEIPKELQKLIKQSEEDAAARFQRPDNRKGPTRVAFGYGSAAASQPSASAGFSKGKSSSGAGGGRGGHSGNGADVKPFLQGDPYFEPKLGKSKSIEPFDTSKYYPVILPLQRPANERTRYLDEDCGVEHDENALSAAQELDLFDESEEDKLMFFQIPASLPLGQDAAVSRESGQDEMVGSVKEGTRNSSAGVKLEKLPEGHVGKLLVYKSGAVKLKIGDVLFDALPGTDCMFAQELAAVNPTAKHCCFLGDVRQRVILTPDIDSLLT
ncbi:hypothetical protein CY35_19G046900 [Sphagnum magellanicum]|jgi:DNA-directed RNA polymerase III subunit RPC4|nr:hypothetical protein CY35_19G046900 [Sphagnum magellanicum]